MLLLLIALVTAAPAAELPAVSATDLAGRELTLPADLEGERNLLLLGFTRKQQDEVETWLPHRPTLQGVVVYQVPLMGPVPGFLRPVIERAMRGSTPDPGDRARFVPVYVAREPVLAALGIEATSTMAAVLVDRAGTVSWTARGPATEAAVADLLEELRR